MRFSILLAALLMTGCIGGSDLLSSGTDRHTPLPMLLDSPVVAIPSCPDACFEPSVALDTAERVFVTTEDGDALARSTDRGATFELLAPPPRPAAAPPLLPLPDGHTLELLNVADAAVHTDPIGRLWWTALVGAAQGIQVARSDDGGDSWAVNVYVSAPTDPAAPPPGIDDRQWLNFAPDGTAYLTYSHIPLGLYVARSDDGGATWTPFLLAASSHDRAGIGLHGPPVADEAGRVLLPHLDGMPLLPIVAANYPPSVALSVSTDRGATWTQTIAVEGTRDLAPYSNPVLARGADGALDMAWIAWRGEGYALAHMRSLDGGGTWSAPRVLDEGVAAIMPWLESGAAGARIAWHRADGTLLVARGEGDEFTSAEADGRAASTHFVAMAVGPEGRAVVAWTQDGAVRIAQERPTE